MSLTKPDIQTSEKFSDTYSEGQRFVLSGIRTVEVNTQDYGKGEMVLLKIGDTEYGIWGQYLLEQARSATDDDLNKPYTIERKVIEGYSAKPVKCLWPARSPDHDDIPF